MGIEKFTNNGKTYKKITPEPITVSMEPKFIFIDEKIGFVISKTTLSESNDYMGLKVTLNGERTFSNSIINYNNSNVDSITIKDVPYKERNILKLPCSIYQIATDLSGYYDKNIIFESEDNELAWNLQSTL